MTIEQMASQAEFVSGQLPRQLLEEVVSRTSEGIVVADAQAEGLPVVYANPAYQTLTGYTLAELTGHACPLLRRGAEQSSEAAPAEVERLHQAIGRAESCEVVVPDLRKDGSTWFSEVNVEPLFGDGGEVQYLLFRQRPAPDRSGGAEEKVASGADSSPANAAARQKADTLSRTDSRTGLLHFEYFSELVQRDLGIARRERTGVALMLFEIMEFDVYHATFGAKAAESCLRMIAAQLNGTLRRASDLATRCADTAYAAFVHARDYDEAHALALRIQRNVRGLGLHNPHATASRHVGVALGVVHVVPESGDELDSLMARARENLQQHTRSLRA